MLDESERGRGEMVDESERGRGEMVDAMRERERIGR